MAGVPRQPLSGGRRSESSSEPSVFCGVRAHLGLPAPQDPLRSGSIWSRLTHHCDIVETRNESWRFKNRA
jgi:hypothetical protein